MILDLHGFGEQLLAGTWMTLKLSLAAVCVGLLLGLLGAIAKTSKYAALRFLGGTYTTIVRGVPETLWVLMIYFGTVSGLNALGDLFGKPDLASRRSPPAPCPRPVLRRLRHRGVPRRAVVLSARPSRGRPGARPVARTDLLAHRPAADLAGRPARPRQPVLILLKDTALVSLITLDEIMPRRGSPPTRPRNPSPST